jgi:hypothetical protein
MVQNLQDLIKKKTQNSLVWGAAEQVVLARSSEMQLPHFRFSFMNEFSHNHTISHVCSAIALMFHTM